ncbi:LysR family transcriptional regulator, partial [Klebsiella pneumoniae]
MRMDLADLRLFIAIVDSGSITGGAAMAHLALASASERVRKLEAEVGVPLLQRHARGVTLTEAGEVLARHARPLLAQQQRLRQAMSAFARGQ